MITRKDEEIIEQFLKEKYKILILQKNDAKR